MLALVIIFLFTKLECSSQQYLALANPWTKILMCLSTDYLYMVNDETALCLSCGLGCKECCDPSLCSKCQDGFYLDKIQSICIRCSASCQQCQPSSPGNYECTKCNIGSNLNDNICTNCIYGCEECEQINILTTCKKCLNTFYLQNDFTCVSCPSGCNACNQDETCTTCINQFYLDTIQNICQVCKIGCNSCESADICTECQQGYQVNDKTCDRCTPFCEYCNPNGGECYACYLQYQLDKENNKCIECKAVNCSRCILNKLDFCTKCNPGYSTNSFGLCVKCEYLCSKCEEDNFCQKCADYNYPDALGKCQYCEGACKLCSSYDFCDQCSDGTYLQNAKCLKCMSNCNNCTSDLDCSVCDPNYFWDGQACQKCGLGCELCNAVKKCTLCYPGYFNQFETEPCGLCVDEICTCDTFNKLKKLGYGYKVNVNVTSYSLSNLYLTVFIIGMQLIQL